MKKYTKEQILIASEIGEISMIDARHIVSLLDEAVILEQERKLRKNAKVSKLLSALNDIRNWDDDLEDKWEDPGYRAKAALAEYYKATDR